MKYYSEEEMKDVRLAFEKKILTWPHVIIKKMFGCPCYQADGRLFAFLVTGGVVITQPASSIKNVTKGRWVCWKTFRAVPLSVWLLGFPAYYQSHP